MSHNHHHHDHSHTHSGNQNILKAFFINFIFTIIEFAGGLFTGSTAILSDAIHDLGDSLTLGLSYIFTKIAKLKPNDKFTYGFRTINSLVSLCVSMLLIMSSLFIIYYAFLNFNSSHEIKTVATIIIAILGVIFNTSIALSLHSGKNIVDKAVFNHMLEDVLGWIAVLLGGIIIYFTQWFWIDPLLSILIALFISYNAVRNIADSIFILLKSVPINVDINKLKNELTSLEAVNNINDLHIWTSDNELIYASIHLCANSYDVKEKVREIFEHFDIEHTTIEIDISNSHVHFHH